MALELLEPLGAGSRGLDPRGDSTAAVGVSGERPVVHLYAAPCTVVLMARPKAGKHRPPPTPDLERLDPATALPLLRSTTWHPDTMGPMLRHISDWLHDTGQHTAAAHLSAISVTDPTTGNPTTMPELIGNERSTIKQQETARRRAAKNAKLDQWRASRS